MSRAADDFRPHWTDEQRMAFRKRVLGYAKPIRLRAGDGTAQPSTPIAKAEAS